MVADQGVGGDHDDHVEFGEDGDLLAGADYRWSDVRADEWSGYLYGVPSELKTTDSSQDMGGVFVQDTWRPNERWQLNGSLRYDYVTNRGTMVRQALDDGAVAGFRSRRSHHTGPGLCR